MIDFASALRRSELAALTLADLDIRPHGLLLTARRSKTDQEGRGHVVGVVHGQHAATDPIAALHHSLNRRGHTPGPLFVNLRTGHLTHDPIHGDGIARMLKRRATAAGLSAERITGHSLRSGHATTAALAGVSIEKIAAQTRHRHLSTLLERYIRPIDALQHTTSGDLGL